MTDFIIGEKQNFYNLSWLDQYMQGHKGFIAGGCFKNIFSNLPVKDIDIFFESKNDFEDAKKWFEEQDDYYHYYQNEKVIAFKHKGFDGEVKPITIELIKTVFGQADHIISNFDFTITKFAYYKTTEMVDGLFGEEPTEQITYKVMYHPDYFQHLIQKRLVIDDLTMFPTSTFERMFRYAKYGYFPCKDTKMKIISFLRDLDEIEGLSQSLYDGVD